MKFLYRFYRDAWTIAVPLTAMIIITPSLALTNVITWEQAGKFNRMGTILIMLLNVFYILFLEIRKSSRSRS